MFYFDKLKQKQKGRKIIFTFYMNFVYMSTCKRLPQIIKTDQSAFIEKPQNYFSTVAVNVL